MRFYSGNSTPDQTVGMLEDYYAWEWGDALFIVLDPYRFTPPSRGTTDNWNPTLGDEQYQWLKQTLETSNAKWKFVFIHQLVGGAGKDGRGGVEAAPYFEWGGQNADGSDGFAQQRSGWPHADPSICWLPITSRPSFTGTIISSSSKTSTVSSIKKCRSRARRARMRRTARPIMATFLVMCWAVRVTSA